MRFVTLLSLLVVMSGCATAKIEHQITMADTTWIQKGITTRSQIEARFGSPNFEVPEYAGSTPQTDKPRDDEYTPKTSTAVIPSPKDTKATYLHPLSEAEMAPSSANLQTKEDRFWVTYDAKNVVKDFGFAGPPATPHAAPTNAPQ
jgi:hypothetical protein